MANRRRFLGAGVAVTASSVAAAVVSAASTQPRDSALPPDTVFVYQSGDPYAIDAARVMSLQGVPVLRFDGATGAWDEQNLPASWAPETVRFVGLTCASGLEQVRALAGDFGLELVHSAPANGGGLISWIIEST